MLTEPTTPTPSYFPRHISSAAAAATAAAFAAAQLVLDAAPLERVSSQEFKKPDTPSRGVSRRGSLFRCNSILDGQELDVSELSMPACMPACLPL